LEGIWEKAVLIYTTSEIVYKRKHGEVLGHSELVIKEKKKFPAGSYTTRKKQFLYNAEECILWKMLFQWEPA